MNPLKHLEYHETESGVKLFAPTQWWKLPEDERAVLTNGCGAKGPVDFVPDTMYGLSIKTCCNIHDVMYEWGTDDWDRLLADVFLLVNLVLFITSKSTSKILKVLRYHRAILYFIGVREGGKKAFYKDK